ncbi:lasso peptide biosynthesis PqqD family chaperone [Clostridium kluyveri]|uniref:lasso peptide biosynthesis PqqD family chaperone n=1 Tax=Clostridium kluyveri TaxID=1534 RepID=UPI002247EF81|nr:lasso peptide biosynthesis PqqD family chaperone [Clostridium kluyveri]UZQ50365.1 lasso peptide biosynthesis PqqD family chaperone [Clostridium kluyveri]
MKAFKIINLQTVVTQKKGLDSTNMNGGIVMMDINRGKYYCFNEVGSRIWELVEKQISIKELVSALLNEFEVDEKTCKDNVLNFLNGIYHEELITVV